MKVGDTDRRPRESIALIRRAQGGDQEAFEHLIARYYPRVYAIVRARLGPELRCYTESADIVQETMDQVVRTFDRFELQDDEALVRWLSRVAENRIRDLVKFYRANKRERGREQGLDLARRDMLPRPLQAAGATPFEQASLEEQRALLATALGGLDARQRASIELRNAGQSWRAIARALEISNQWAAQALHAKAMLCLMRAVAQKPTIERAPRG